MSKYVFALVSLALATPLSLSLPAYADAPAILAAPNNQAPACATPGRLMAFLTDRNGNMDPRYENLAALYQRIGTELGVRWDFAFHQMLVETGFLTYTGDVRAKQNNFAGIAAVGNGAPGESFRSVEDGVRAHLEHLLVYADVRVENPVADRTRKVQSWAIYKGWPKRLGRPVNFRDMAAKWAPGGGYWRMIDSVADRFMRGRCLQPDPAPQAVASKTPAKTSPSDARGTGPQQQYTLASGSPASRTDEARRRAEAVGTATRSSLGAAVSSSSVTVEAAEAADVKAKGSAEVAVINKQSASASGDQGSTSQPQTRNETGTASDVGRFASNFISAPSAPTAEQPKACRVWQASYGGQQAVVIKSVGGDHVNYTVLDVNKGREDREIEAYVAAYAKGGETVAQFPDQTSALRRAFELCPSAAKTQVSQ